MANYKIMGQWLLKHTSVLNFKATKGKWVSEWLPRFHDYQVNISLEGKSYQGHGIDQDEELAMIKALSEAIERAICTKYNINSTGVAVHSNIDEAISTAKRELIERDIFLCHFLTNKPFKNSYSSRIDTINMDLIKSKLESYGVFIHLFEMTPTKELFNAVCISTCPKGKIPYSSIIGLGCEYSLMEAQKKALLECLRNTVWFIKEGHKENIDINCNTFQSKSIHNSEDHHNLYLNKECYPFIEDLINSNAKSLEQNDIFLNQILCKSLEPVFSVIADAPIYISQASSDKLQNIFYGPTTEEKINFERLSQFKGSKICYEKINQNPHCLA